MENRRDGIETCAAYEVEELERRATLLDAISCLI